MKVYKFNSDRNLSATYICLEEGNVSGEYVKLSEVRMFLDELITISKELTRMLNTVRRETIRKKKN